MAATKRNYQQIEADRVEMNRLALAGVSQAEIAGRFGVSQPQVAYDLRAVRERWKESTNMNLEAARNRELALLDRVEACSWEGWERAERDGDGGGVRYAAVLLRVSEQRAALLDLPNNPPKVAMPDDAAKAERLRRVEAAYRQMVRRETLEEFGLNETGAPKGRIVPPTAVGTVISREAATN